MLSMYIIYSYNKVNNYLTGCCIILLYITNEKFQIKFYEVTQLELMNFFSGLVRGLVINYYG